MISSISPEERAALMAADFLGLLGDNIQAFGDVAQRTRKYRLYAFCRRHEAERNAFHSALAWAIKGEGELGLRCRWTHRLHRFLIRFRTGRASGIGQLVGELRHEDRILRDRAEALLAEPGLDGAVWMVLGKLVSVLRAADAEMALLVGHRRGERSMPAPHLSPGVVPVRG